MTQARKSEGVMSETSSNRMSFVELNSKRLFNLLRGLPHFLENPVNLN